MADLSSGELQQRLQQLEAERDALRLEQQTLKKELHLYRSLFEATPNPVFYKDEQGRYQGCNPAYTALTGLTPEDMRGRTVHDLWPGELAEVYHQKDLELMANPSRQIYEFKVVDRYGVHRPAIHIKNALRDESGMVCGLLGGFIDVSALRQTERELEAMFNMSPDLLCIAEVSSARFVKVNPAFTATLGWSEKELLGRPFFDFIHPDDIERTRRVVEEQLDRGKAVLNFNNRYRTSDGDYRWLRWASRPESGSGLTYAVAHDITDEIRAADALRSSRDLLNSLFDSIPLGITIWEASGALQMVNKGFTDLTGYSLAEVNDLGGWFTLAYPDPEYRSSVLRSWKEDQGGKELIREFSVTCRSGAVKIIEFRPAFLDDGRSLVTLADVTERRHALQERENAYLLLQSIFDAVPDLLMVFDRDCNILFSNNQSKDRNQPAAGRDAVHPCRFKGSDANCGNCSVLPVFATGKNIEQEMVDPDDGSIREVRAFPIFDSSGQVTRVVQHVRDITELKTAREELRRRRQFLEAVLHQAPDAIITMDADHHVIDWNPGAETMFGYTPDEAIGLHLDELVAPGAVAKEAGGKTAQVLSGSMVEPFETIRFRRDGTPVNVIAAGAPILIDGRLTGVVALYTDITARVQAENALKASHQRFLTVLESLDATIYVADMETYTVLFMNRHMKEHFGGDMTGKVCWRAFRGEDGPCPDCSNDKLLDAAGNPCGVHVWQGRNPLNGRWYMNHDRAIEWTDGRMARLQIAYDITDQKRMEEGLRQAQKMEAIGTLAGGIAHDFNNLLMGIQGRTSLVSLDLGQGHPEQEHLDAIEEYIRSAMGLTKQLLGLVRGGKYEVKPLDINDLVEKSAAMFGRTRKEIGIHVRPAPHEIVVEADRPQIEQVLLNMFVNAWQAMPEGGSLFLATERVELDAAACSPHGLQPGVYAKVSITDTGTGMEEGVMHRIFDPFFTTKDKGRGTGLGLASAYGIIRNHGGKITVYSEVGTGTTFNIYLPVSDRQSPQPALPQQEPLTGTGRILLVDDEPMILEVGQALLERLGYEVHAAAGGAEAVEALEQGLEADLVILDMIMPGLDGRQTFHRLRQIRPGLPVILSSGYSINGQAQEIMNQGCNAFIQKPFNLAELSRKVAEVLQG